ncbi:MAG: penicillin-binding protein activator LpoB [Spirochaetes bacterium]|nr:penicillin-binding protein activator LpoB [Spirochaetota bacterium]
MKKKLFLLLIILILFLAACKTTDKKAETKKEKPQYPELVEKLILPSGFDNTYVLNLKEGIPVEFEKTAIRVLDFEKSPSFLKAIRNTDINVEEKIKSKIANTGRFNLLGTEEDLQAVIKEQMRIGDDSFDSSDAPELGYLKIAAYVLVGKITHSIPKVKQMGGYFSLKVSVGFSLTMTNAETGEVVYTKEISAENEDKLFVSSEGMIIKGPRNLTDKPLNAIGATGSDIDLVPQYLKALELTIAETVYFLEEKHPIMGEVVNVKDSEIITTANQADGIKPGDYIFIVRIGDPMKDSLGKLLGFDKEMIGAYQISTVESNMSRAVLVKLKNPEAKPQKQDIVISLPASIND